MSRYCALIGQRLGWDVARCEMLRLASILHDVGKIGIPDNILLKQGPLTVNEFAVMKEHVELGRRILLRMNAEPLQLAATIAWTHHEKYDGSGYSRRLAGEAIPLEGRIAAIADVFDALTTDKVYRPAHTLDKALAIMRRERGKHFDPNLLDLFLESMDDVLAIKAQYSDAHEHHG
jgi:putative two-component system response regulator